MRAICEKYRCLPSEVEDLTIDQIMLLIADYKRVEKLGGLRHASIRELQRDGAVPWVAGGSYVQRLRALKALEAQQAKRAGKRERRQQRREQLVAYQREQGHLAEH